METTMINLSAKLEKQFFEYAEQSQPEIYWGYDDSLSASQIEALFEVDGFATLQDEIWEMNMDYIWDLESEAIKGLIDNFEEEISEELQADREDWEEDVYDYLKDLCLFSVELNIKDLIKNTGDQVFFYDTGICCGDYSLTEEERKEEREEIKKLLNIKDNSQDEKIEIMQLQASYGGQLVIYFNMSPDDIINQERGNTICFSNPAIAIIDTLNGSGDHCFIKGKFETAYNSDNLFYDKGIKYNYTFAVCCMYSNWCDCTEVSWTNKEQREAIAESPIIAQKKQDKEYQQTYNSGKCTFGDMDFLRHRNVQYINNFPCGHKCMDCGTFWID